MRLFRRRNEVAQGDATDQSNGSNNGANKRKAALQDRSKWYWRFAQQRLSGWSPIVTGTSVVLYFFAVGVFCTALGVPILTASLGIHEASVRYDNQGPFAGLSMGDSLNQLYSTNGDGVTFSVPVTVNQTLDPPVYVYYELHSYYQNHKRYVRSRSDKQLGNDGTIASACAPEEYVNGTANSALPASGAIDPCGLTAWSFFNDSYSATITPPGGARQALAIDESNIAWSYDRDHLYGDEMAVNFNIFPDKRGGNTTTVPVNQNEHLMVWLRPAAQPSFRKLWGVIDVTIPAGSVVNLTVDNKYNMYAFDGAKKFVLSTNSWVGGKNLFLGIIYLVVAGLAFATCFAFFAAYHLGLAKKRRFGDVSQLSWNRK